MQTTQPGILEEETRLSRYLTFSLHNFDQAKSALATLSAYLDTKNNIVGIGANLVDLLQGNIPGLRDLPAASAPGIAIPSTPGALWCWLRGDDRGELFQRSRQIQQLLEPAFRLSNVTDGFQYKNNRDLSGYEDGTENPKGKEAEAAALVQDSLEGMNGSSFVAVQKWIHNFDTLSSLSTEEKDNIIGRHIIDNEEFDEAPESAHVKRSAQESYSPEAFILRRSMPWAEDMQAGLMFVAFGKSLDAFEAILNRMLGKEDGIVDGLFKFTQPISGAYYWCPPVKQGKLDLTLLDM